MAAESPEPLPAHVAREVQRILDAAARRLLHEQLERQEEIPRAYTPINGAAA